MLKILKFVTPVLCLIPSAAKAVCPVCTAAVLVGLEGARRTGVDETIVGVWAGGLFLALVMLVWTIMRKNGVKNPLWYLLPPLGPISLLISMWMMDFGFGAGVKLGVDKFLLGVIAGAIAFFIAAKWHMNIKRKNSGKSWFPMQKVVWPVGALVIVSAIFAGIIYL
jgi:hypothetical protein